MNDPRVRLALAVVAFRAGVAALAVALLEAVAVL